MLRFLYFEQCYFDFLCTVPSLWKVSEERKTLQALNYPESFCLVQMGKIESNEILLNPGHFL